VLAQGTKGWKECCTYVFDNHHQKRQLDAESLLRVSGALDKGGTDVRTHDFEDRGLDIRVRNALNVTISNCGKKRSIKKKSKQEICGCITFLVPNLQGLAPVTYEEVCARNEESVVINILGKNVQGETYPIE